MPMKTMRNFARLRDALLGLCGIGCLFLAGAGCEIDSSESATRNVPIIVTGFYAGNGGSAMVSRTTGAPVLTMNVRQNGDQLEVIDNNGIVFRGSIGQVLGNGASFTLTGRATSGQEVTISGNFNVDGTSSTMTGSWIEPTLVSTLSGTSTVPELDPGDGGTTNETETVETNDSATSETEESGTSTNTPPVPG